MLALFGLILVAALIPVHGLIQLGSNTGRAWHQRVHIMRTIAAQWLPFVGLMIGAANSAPSTAAVCWKSCPRRPSAGGSALGLRCLRSISSGAVLRALLTVSRK